MIQIKVRELSESDLMIPIHSRRYLVSSPKGLAIDNRQDIESMYGYIGMSYASMFSTLRYHRGLRGGLHLLRSAGSLLD